MIVQTIKEVKETCPNVNIRTIEEEFTDKNHNIVSRQRGMRHSRIDGRCKRHFEPTPAGLSTYSNSKSIVSSYVSIFESLMEPNGAI